MSLLKEIAGSKQLNEGTDPGPSAAYDFAKSFGGALAMRKKLAASLAEILKKQNIETNDEEFKKHLTAAVENLAWQLKP